MGLGCPPSSLIHVIQHNINQDIRGIVDARTFQCKRSELVGKTIPPKELAKVDVAYLESLGVREVWTLEMRPAVQDTGADPVKAELIEKSVLLSEFAASLKIE